MTVKVNPDHLQNEIGLRLGQDLPLIKISCESMQNFLREAAHRQNDRNRPNRMTSALAEVHFFGQNVIIRSSF